MKNYYFELELDQSMSTEEIKAMLISLENTWIKREVVNPEKARKMLILIDEAKKVFDSDATREKYDFSLKEENHDSHADQNIADLYLEWIQKAKSFCDTSNYDMARVALNNAIHYAKNGQADDLYYYLDTFVCEGENNFDSALNSINNAILLNDNNPYYYLEKGRVYVGLAELAEEQGYHSQKIIDYVQQAQVEDERALNLAISQNDCSSIVDAYHDLVVVYCLGYASDKTKALEYARQYQQVEKNPEEIKKLFELVESSTDYVPYQGSSHPSSTSNVGGGCYVATCVYGSYDCPEVWTLRRYRDHSLSKSWHGRVFIKTYYAVSPTLVKWFGGTNWFKAMWRGKLDRIISKLNVQGYEDTPYDDSLN